MNKPTIIEGKAIVIRDENEKAIDDIDTDMIFHNRWLHITNTEEMGQHAFGNLQGWEEFPKMVSGNDILIVGKNFGAGSSRQQAVDCFKALDITLIIGESFGAIYKRNAINSGMPLMIATGDSIESQITTGDKIKVDLTTGDIFNESKNLQIKATPLSQVQLDIHQAGNLFEYGKTLD